MMEHISLFVIAFSASSTRVKLRPTSLRFFKFLRLFPVPEMAVSLIKSERKRGIWEQGV